MIKFQLSEILPLLNPQEIVGECTGYFHGIAALSEAQRGEVSFVEHPKYYKALEVTQASLVIVPLDCPHSPSENQVFLKVQNPALALIELSKFIERSLSCPRQKGIHATAVVAPSAQIAPTATVGPFCVIGEGAVIGDYVHLVAQVYVGNYVQIGAHADLMPHVSIADRCVIGDRVRLHSGVVIGSDGFGYHYHQGQHLKEPQIGTVVVEDDVEIGANTTIDRARFSETRIGKGTKIDNLVQIAHNVKTGSHCILVAQSAIAGGTTLGNGVVVGGQAGIVGHMHIGDGTMIGAQSGINHSLPAKSYVRGTPAMPFQQAMRLEVLHRRLPEFAKKLASLESQLQSIQGVLSGSLQLLQE
jgi:UDP-3-O-[3-hydroxymyristoyl] glucosamine N-acyltransferase